MIKFISHSWNPGVALQGCNLQLSLVCILTALTDRWGWWQLLRISSSENLMCASPSNHYVFAFRSMPSMTYIAHVVTGLWCRWGERMQCPCLCVTPRVSFSTWAPVQSPARVNQHRTWTCILSPSSNVKDPSDIFIHKFILVLVFIPFGLHNIISSFCSILALFEF